jgi:hypothetical protein
MFATVTGKDFSILITYNAAKNSTLWQETKAFVKNGFK